MDKDLHQKLNALPDNLKSEVEHFVDALLSGKKMKAKSKAAIRERRKRRSKKEFFLTAGLWKDRNITLEQIRAKAFPRRK